MVDDELPCITDLSAVDAEDFKVRNTSFLIGGSHYDNPYSKPVEELRHEIWAVRNQDRRRVIRGFPLEDPLLEQCGLWMRAVVGKHYFPDANHRTAIALLRELLRDNGIEPGSWPIEKTKTVRARSHDVRRELPPVTLDTLYERDELYDLWFEYFQDVSETMSKRA